ncbi:MAG: beta-ketoacyl synthase N-terminal-like domain-containing protein [Coxiellaceae bacterium]|nr:beta-ketoacyl synthase N-terminal-like domain-containing protein [Coxiellaceae bacterium]
MASLKNHQLNSVVLSSWAAVYSDYCKKTLVDAAFQDIDLVPDLNVASIQGCQAISPRERAIINPVTLPAVQAIERAWSSAGFPVSANSLRGKGARIRFPRAAIVAGSSLGHVAAVVKESANKKTKRDPYTMSRMRGNSIAAPLAIRFGFGGASLSVSAASATGGQAIWLAANLIRVGAADQVVVVCTDSMGADLVDEALSAVGATAACLTSRPLSSERSGMRPVEAAVAVVLESEECAIDRQCKPLARWVSGSVKNECHHLIAPEPLGAVLKEASEEAVGNSSYQMSDIDWLSMHATGTRVWDQIEAQLANNMFGNQIPHISAFKRTFGHTLGAAGLLEACMVAEGLSQKRLPLWPQGIDPGLQLPLPCKLRACARNAITWSAGMGGDIAVNLFEAME